MIKDGMIRPSSTVNPSKGAYIPIIPKGLAVVRDTREQQPYEFNRKIPYKDMTLNFGDYSIVGMEDMISVERKSLSDFYGSITHGRDRLKRMFDRMQVAEFKALVIEAPEDMVMSPELSYSNVKQHSIYATIVSLEIKHGIHVYYGSRKDCQIKIINWFTTFYKFKSKPGKANSTERSAHGSGK